MGITTHTNLSTLEKMGQTLAVEKIGGYVVLTNAIRVATTKQLFIKRMMDIAGSVVGLILCAIFTVTIGPIIYIMDPGPIFFSQERVGKNGKRFRLYKFRSMYMDAEERKDELVFIDCSPYYYIDPLHSSIPYLVPRAAVLLQDIGQAFFDSLQVKGVPLHRFIVTSVLRTQEDVAKLRRHNGNATENSCHLYGTTIDICYNRYQTVEDPDGPSRRQVRNDSLKFILSEVLNDMRQQNRCFVKYEVKQGCFHMTVR
jgi:hypothetical protein